MTRAAVIVALAAALAGAWRAARLAWADILYQRGGEPNIRRAIALEPERAEYALALGDLERAARLNPRDSATLIELGVRAEMRGDTAGAERRLLDAARVDRTYAPRWALANFYFRRNDAGRFWLWAARAAKMSYGDTGPLFRLMWDLGGPEANRHIPPRPDLERQYLAFLLSTGRLDDAPAGAAPLLARRAPEDRPPLLAYCDRLIAAGRAAQAASVWNALEPREAFGARAGLVNGAFRTPPASRGFDWRLPSIPGVAAALDRGALRIEYTGDQPERCEALYQYLLLTPGRAYTLRWEYRTAGIAPDTGLRWRVLDGPAVLAESSGLSSGEWTAGALRLDTPASINAPRLVLLYQRAPGSTRIEGALWLRNVGLEAAP
jgi:hypothetical protein